MSSREQVAAHLGHIVLLRECVSDCCLVLGQPRSKRVQIDDTRAQISTV